VRLRTQTNAKRERVKKKKTKSRSHEERVQLTQEGTRSVAGLLKKRNVHGTKKKEVQHRERYPEKTQQRKGKGGGNQWKKRAGANNRGEKGTKKSGGGGNYQGKRKETEALKKKGKKRVGKKPKKLDTGKRFHGERPLNHRAKKSQKRESQGNLRGHVWCCGGGCTPHILVVFQKKKKTSAF